VDRHEAELPVDRMEEDVPRFSSSPVLCCFFSRRPWNSDFLIVVDRSENERRLVVNQFRLSFRHKQPCSIVLIFLYQRSFETDSIRSSVQPQIPKNPSHGALIRRRIS
jgi:hypothetical protein